MTYHADHLPTRIAALTSRTYGHQFVIYGDACSGVPGGKAKMSKSQGNAVLLSASDEEIAAAVQVNLTSCLLPDPSMVRLETWGT